MPMPIRKSTLWRLRCAVLFFTVCTLFWFGTLFMSFITSKATYEFNFFDGVAILFGIICASFTGLAYYYGWNAKTELTIEEKIEAGAKSKKFKEELEGKWYFRYPMAIFMLGIAFIVFQISESDIKLYGVSTIVFNPIVAALAAICALIIAWEILLITIGLGIVWLLFIGISALPTSVAIIIGAITIAVAIKYRT